MKRDVRVVMVDCMVRIGGAHKKKLTSISENNEEAVAA